jgi:GT2 family glycosyltransferase
VPVLAVLVCHDGASWLGEALDALRRSAPRPRHVLAVDTGSTDATATLLAAAATGPDAVLDGVLRVDRGVGFGAAVAQALTVAVNRWGDPGQWLWLLHDDCAPEPDCLGVLLNAAELSPAVGALGPLALDWDDPRLVVEVGLSTDASGHRQTGIGPTELDWDSFQRNREAFARAEPEAGSAAPATEPTQPAESAARSERPAAASSRFEQSSEVLAVSSAGALIRREVWDALGGYDPALPLLRDDLDFGWRANRSGRIVLCVPAARMRHARAASRGLRDLDAVAAPPGPRLRAVDRAHGMRTLLVNCATPAFLIGLPRLLGLSVLRALGFLLLRRVADARSELRAAGYLLRGRAGLRVARGRRRRELGRAAGTVRGLLTTRLTRLRNLLRTGAVNWVRRRVAEDVALGRLPAQRASARILPDYQPESTRPIGPAALPAGALGKSGSRRVAGLRRPATSVVVPLAESTASQPSDGLRPSPRPRPSPSPRTGTNRPSGPSQRELVLVDVGKGRIARELLLAPPLLLVLALTVISLATNLHRLGGGLAGGGLLPAQGLAGTWSEYLASWHAVSGGATTPAPAALAVLGVLGTVLYPFGGPPTALAVLLIGDAPLAGLLAYLATRRLSVPRWVRALLAAGYALLPPATAAVAQGRVAVVVVHVLLPPVLVGVVAVLNPATRRRGANSWLSTAATSSLGLAVIGAFAPLAQLLVLVFALAGFVVVPNREGDSRRRVAALFAVVLLPLALLVPWPAVVLEHPALLLSGVGNSTPSAPGNLTDLLMLDPGGPASVPWFGALVGLAALVAVIVRPRRAALPGFALVLLGAVVTGVLATVALPGFDGHPELFSTGPGLIVVGGGLLWMVLGTCRTETRSTARTRTTARTTAKARRTGQYPVPMLRVLAGLGVLTVLVLATGTLLAGRAGPLRANGAPTLAPVLTSELAQTGRSTLVMAADGQPTRTAGGRTPAFGDDDIAPAPGALARLADWDDGLRSVDAATAKDAVADAAIAGVLFVVAPDQATAHRLETLAGNLVSPVPSASDGRPVLRLQPAGGAATLISTSLANAAVTGGQPPTRLGVVGVSPVDAAPPDVAVRVSEGAAGRLLVLAAEDQSGWQATVDGQTAPITRAWGHLVAVVVPLDGADIRIWQPTALRDILLLVQAAVLLFAALTAIPSRR